MDNIRRRFNSPTKSLGAGTPGEAADGKLSAELDPDGGGGGGGTSVFHTPLVTWGPDAVQEAGDRVAEHLMGVDAFCSTGTTAVGQLGALLRGSPYAAVADQCRQRLQEVQHFTKVEVAQVAAEVKVTLAKVSPRVDDKGVPLAVSDEDIKLVATAFTRLMQLHCQFLLTASEALAPLSKCVKDGSHPSPNNKSDGASQSDIPAAGQLSQSNSPSQESSQSAPATGSQGNNEQDSGPKSPTAEHKSNMVHAVGSPSGLRKISSFFSKLGRSGSLPSDESQSSFYVAIPKEEVAAGQDDNKENSEGGGGAQPHPHIGVHPPVDGSTTSISKLKLPTNSADVLQVSPGVPPNGRLATQEELDSVIDLLSGGQRSPMQVIPENIPSHHITAVKMAAGPPPPPPPPPPIGHYPPSLFSMPPPDGPPPPLDCGLYRNHPQHRRSDGLLVADTFPRDHKTNTWPYRPRAAGGGGGSDLGSSLVHTLPGPGCYDGGGAADMDYTRYLASVKAMKSSSCGGPGAGGSLGGSFGGQGPWSSSDAGLHRSWPMHLFNHDGGENTSRNWSTVGDSSSCSDESSTGDNPWSMGLDLVGAVSDKRRHSSGEESFPGAPPPGHVNETRPRSVENLLDSKSTNTWPPKQPWAKHGVPGGGRVDSSDNGHMHPPTHPPLTMQWSDPLTNRPLSAWDGAGTIPSFSNQRLQSFPSLLHGGSTELLPPGGLHERHFSARK